MHPIYESIQLTAKSLSQLKEIYAAIACTSQVADKRRRQDWQQAILEYQSAQVEKVAVVEVAATNEPSAEYQDLLDQIGHIRYAWEDSNDTCINYENGNLWLTSEPESEIHVIWEIGKSENDVVYEILELVKTLLPIAHVAVTEVVIPEQPKICATCPLFKPFSDGTGRGLCCGVADSSLVVREHHQQTKDCLNLIDDQEQQLVPAASVPASSLLKQVVYTFYKEINAWRITTDTAYFQKLTELREQYPLGELVGGVHDSEQQFVAYVPVGKHQNIADPETAIDEQNTNDAALIPGYSWCLTQGIQFKQRTKSDTGTVYWYAEANNYYGQTGRSYKTSSFEKLENAVRAAVDYLGKCGIDLADVKQQLIDRKKAEFKAENAPIVVVEEPAIQSGSLTFKPVSRESKVFKLIYSITRESESLGTIAMNHYGQWATSNKNDLTYYATPYEAAAALLNPSVSTPEIVALVPEIEIDSAEDSDFGLLYRVWHSYHLLGTFYRGSGRWVAQHDTESFTADTPEQAQLLIVAAAGLLVADTHEEADLLLDKPVDELTVAEWNSIKQRSRSNCLTAH